MEINETFYVAFFSWLVFLVFGIGFVYLAWINRTTLTPQSSSSEISIPIHLVQKKTIADEYDFHDEETPRNTSRSLHSRKQSVDAKRKLFLALTDESNPLKMTPILEGENEDEDQSESLHENRAGREHTNDRNDRPKRELGYVSRVFDLSNEDMDTTELGRGIYISPQYLILPSYYTKKHRLISSQRPSQRTSFSTEVDDFDCDAEPREFPDIDLPEEHYYHSYRNER